MNTHHNYGDAGAIGSAVNMDPTQAIYDGNEIMPVTSSGQTTVQTLEQPTPLNRLWC
jgi:hypothetical protein